MLLIICIPVIAWIDHKLLSPLTRCPRCGAGYGMVNWLLPTTLEIFLFIVGIAVGMVITK